MTRWVAKNSGPQRRLVFSQAVALAPFSQNDRVRGGCGLAQAQLTQAKPSMGLFCLSSSAAPASGIFSRIRMLATE